jgi:hypothetical protein
MMMLMMTYRSWMAPFDDFEMDASLIVLMSCVNGIHELSSHYLMQTIRKRTLIGILCIIFYTITCLFFFSCLNPGIF